MVAAYRARATARPEAICNDPWAQALAGDEGQELARALDAVFAPMELWIAVRTATLDKLVERFSGGTEGARQIVILGAGFDTRAARLAGSSRAFFEVDHPATQAEKQRRLALLSGYPYNAATRVACDFERDDFLTSLERAGFERDAPALFVWEGVTPYLPEVAIRATLRRIAEGTHPRSIVVFDHLLKLKSDAENPSQAFVAGLGEKVVFGTNDPLPLLYEEGFREVRSLSFDEACLSLTGTYERSRQFRFQRLAVARRERLGWMPL
jgi:methyltransferase (TIGR00027 family)